MGLRLEPVDEYMHELGPESTFNESMYFNAYDPAATLGAFFRVGNRANEGTGEMTCCIYLPDGRTIQYFPRGKDTVRLTVLKANEGAGRLLTSACTPTLRAASQPVHGSQTR